MTRRALRARTARLGARFLAALAVSVTGLTGLMGLTASAALASPPAATQERYTFALIGDVPYSAHERTELPRMLAAIGAENVAFAVHDGDIKGGRESCADTLLRERHALLDASPVPLFYTPGDNEWTDCDRLAAGHFHPEERLGFLRRLFFADGQSLGKKRLPYEQQAEWRENARWPLGPVRFVTVNVTGSDNNFGPGPLPSPEFVRRNTANLAWLEESFALARTEKSRGVVVVMQANPGWKHYEGGLAHQGYRDFLDLLKTQVLAFDGPVVVVHGDTHWHRIDHPLRDPVTRQPLLRFTRVETYGYPIMGWVKGIIDPASPELFRFESRPWPPR